MNYAPNVGDLVDELAMQRYIIVPALSAVDPKIDPLEALLVSTFAKQTALKANLGSFETKHRKEFEDLMQARQMQALRPSRRLGPKSRCWRHGNGQRDAAAAP